jgi:hypothetical protein
MTFENVCLSLCLCGQQRLAIPAFAVGKARDGAHGDVQDAGKGSAVQQHPPHLAVHAPVLLEAGRHAGRGKPAVATCRGTHAQEVWAFAAVRLCVVVVYLLLAAPLAANAQALGKLEGGRGVQTPVWLALRVLATLFFQTPVWLALRVLASAQHPFHLVLGCRV